MTSPWKSGNDVRVFFSSDAESRSSVDTSPDERVSDLVDMGPHIWVQDGAWHTEALSVLGEHKERG